MTAQINDSVFHQKIEYNLAGIDGEGLFDPKDYGFVPQATCTACWRGYYLAYEIKDDRLFLMRAVIGFSKEDTEAAMDGQGPTLFGTHADFNEKDWGAVYEDLNHQVPFSGGLLLADGFLHKLYVHMGFHPAWKYERVREVLFEDGKVIADLDRSGDMRKVRERILSEEEKPDIQRGSPAILEWIKKCFSRDY